MGQKDCTYSVIKKPCPKKRFPCSRCGARIVNAGLQWEMSVPQHRQWVYLDPVTLAPNAAATATPIIVYAPHRVPNFDEETQADSPCKFDGPSADEFFNLVQGQSPVDGGAFVQDFEWQRFDDDFDGWNWFIRKHVAIVSWQAAEVEEHSGELITPGRWKIDLTIIRAAQAFILDWEFGTNPGWFNLALGGESFNLYGGEASADPTEAYGNAALTKATYYAPDDYECLGAARFYREIPTLPILTDGHTIDTLPSDYQWPDGVPTHADGMALGYAGPFFPVGFEQSYDIYYAPPYIDVRHTKK